MGVHFVNLIYETKQTILPSNFIDSEVKSAAYLLIATSP